MEDFEDNGVSLGQIFRVIFNRKLVFLIVSVCVAVVLFVGIYFIYNPLVVSYEVGFNYDVPAISSGKYIDGTTFSYNDLVSYENMSKVKASDEKYQNIDIDKIYNDNALTVEYTKDEKNETKNHYTVKIKTKYLKGETGKSFILDIVNYPLTYTKKLANELTYDTSLKLYPTSPTFEILISRLEEQYSYIASAFESIKSTYGDKTYNGRLLSYIISEYNEYFSYNSLQNMRIELNNNGYVYNYEENKSYLEGTRATLQKEYDINELKIAALYEEIEELKNTVGTTQLQTYQLESYNSEIVSLTLRNVELDDQIKIIDDKIAKGSTNIDESKAFKAKLDVNYNKLTEYTEEYQDISKDVYSEHCNVIYYDGKVTQEGGVSLLITAILSVVAGLVVASVVNLVLDRKMLEPGYFNKKKEENEPKEQ